jgi:hypothetical protein
MTALLPWDSQIATSLLPLGSVRRNSSPACSKLREDMSKLVPQREIDFVGMLNQPRVKRNQFLAIIRAACGGFKPGIPFNAKFCCDSFRT